MIHVIIIYVYTLVSDIEETNAQNGLDDFRGPKYTG